MMLRKLFLGFIALFSLQMLNAQISVPFDTSHWDIRAQEYELTSYKGKDALQLNGGMAYLENANFVDGTVEWDMAFPNQRGFTGLRFRIQDFQNLEEFYLRPHQSGKPDANQYCPVDNGLSTWQLYHGPEYSVAYDYAFDQWFHVKMVISGTRAEVYIDDMSKPALYIPFLKHEPRAGGLMVYAGMVPTYFANFSYTPSSKPILVNPKVAEMTLDPLTIPTWSVSSPFPDSLLAGNYDLKEFNAKQLSWQDLNVEASGTANLGTVAEFDRVLGNTVFAKVTINASTDQLKGLTIGFSDRARVYCNGQLLFSGNDAYRTRDFRYLGTIGYFDTVYLPLQKGANEVWIAVTENFGGWGLRGKLEDWKGIDLVY